MTPHELARLRLQSQAIAQPLHDRPAEVVAALGAMQGQDYAGGLFSIGLRLTTATLVGVEQAIAEAAIVRTWLLRGTLHIVAAEDLRWLLALLGGRNIAGSAGRLRQLELDGSTISRAGELIAAALSGGKALTRPELFELLNGAGISTAGQRGVYILWTMSQQGLLCFGPHRGKQPTFVLLDEWVPAGHVMDGEQALAELAQRYFTSHGPATLQDFCRWAGIPATQARAGLEVMKQRLREVEYEGNTHWLGPLQSAAEKPLRVHLLPGFDEYLLGYRDRSAVLDAEHSQKVVPGGNGVFMPTLVVDGRVSGTWKPKISRKGVTVTLSPFGALDQYALDGAQAAAERYGRFLGLPVLDAQGA